MCACVSDAEDVELNRPTGDMPFRLVAGATQRGKDLLVSTDGFSYTVKVYLQYYHYTLLTLYSARVTAVHPSTYDV